MGGVPPRLRVHTSMKIEYVYWRPQSAGEVIIDEANRIIADYQRQGYVLTLRGLYYQFISRDTFPESWIDQVYNARKGLPANTKNTDKNYHRLGGLIVKGRMAGLIDWDAIEDRTRELTEWRVDLNVQAAITRVKDTFRVERWERQPVYVEVWVEKEALAGVFDRICYELSVPFFACKGYASKSSMQEAAERLRDISDDRDVTILHFGDHDPSGIDMTRDIMDQMETFETSLEVKRIALNMDQVREHDPPPNPTKFTDPRATGYLDEYGDESWELDALEPRILSDLVRTEVEELIDSDLWAEADEEETEADELLDAIVDRFDDVVELVS